MTGADTSQGAAAAIRVLVTSSARIHREALAKALGGRTGIQIAACDTGESAVALTSAGLRPTVALVDAQSRDLARLVRQLLRSDATLPVVAANVEPTETAIVRVMALGCAAYLTENGSIQELVALVRQVATGRSPYLSRHAATALRQLALRAPAVGEGAFPLSVTRREREIVALLDEGLSNKEIAARLHISVATTKNHVHNILKKLGVSSRYDACRMLARSADQAAATAARDGRPVSGSPSAERAGGSEMDPT